MPRYHFKSPSVVDDVSFFENDKGTVRAYLHASEGITDDQLTAVVMLLRHNDLDAIPYDLDGKPVLEVRNFGKPSKLISKLKDEHIVSGSPAIEKLDTDYVSFKDKLANRTLQLSGALQLLGDVGYYQYNKLEGHGEGQIASYCYALGTYFLVGYGRNDQSETQVRDMAKGFEQFLEKKGHVIPDDSALHAVAHEQDTKNPLLKAHKFFQRYPTEFYNTFTGLAGAMVAVNAYRNQYVPGAPAHYGPAEAADFRKEAIADILLGTTTFLATSYGTLAKEKTHDPDEPEPTGFIGKTVKNIRNRPLTVTGMGLMASTLFHAYSTTIAYRAAKKAGDMERIKSVPWRGLFVVANLMAEILIMVSSKGHGHGVVGDDTVHKTAYKMAAEVVLAQPEEKHDYMINYMADFLQQPDVLAQKHDVVIDTLKKEVEALKKNPWSISHQVADAQSSEHVLMSDQHAKSANHHNSWAEKVSAAAEVGSPDIQPSAGH